MKHTSGTLTTRARTMIPTTSRIDINRIQTSNINPTGNNYRNSNNQGNSFSKPYAQNNNSSDQGNNSKTTNLQDKPTNVTVTLKGLMSREQLYKIQEVLRHPSQYQDRLKPKDRPATGPYASTFNKF